MEIPDITRLRLSRRFLLFPYATRLGIIPNSKIAAPSQGVIVRVNPRAAKPSCVRTASAQNQLAQPVAASNIQPTAWIIFEVAIPEIFRLCPVIHNPNLASTPPFSLRPVPPVLTLFLCRAENQTQLH